MWPAAVADLSQRIVGIGDDLSVNAVATAAADRFTSILAVANLHTGIAEWSAGAHAEFTGRGNAPGVAGTRGGGRGSRALPARGRPPVHHSLQKNPHVGASITGAASPSAPEGAKSSSRVPSGSWKKTPPDGVPWPCGTTPS